MGIPEGEKKVVALTHDHHAPPHGHPNHVEWLRHSPLHLHPVLGEGAWR